MVDKCWESTKKFANGVWNSVPIPYSKSKTPISAPVQCPIVYSPDYDITFWGFERCLHKFDSGKWGKVLDQLIASGRLTIVFKPNEVGEDDLRRIHSADYLESLKDIRQLARILEIPGLFYAKHFRYVYDVGHRILHSLRMQTGGTILAAELALQEKWAINIGGGFHHASGNHGGGFCVYADISIALRKLFDEGRIHKAMIVDLDAHQGNGHEMDFLNNPNVYIMDMFNADIYPRDFAAMKAIKMAIKLTSGTNDSTYLPSLRRYLAMALDSFHPDLIIYNAGTDVLAGDPLGRLNISVEGIIERDEIVFHFARHSQIPIAMVTSGGYSMQSADVIVKSILNLDVKGLIELH